MFPDENPLAADCCPHGRSLARPETVTVQFNPCDAVSIIIALREVVDPDTLRVVANAELTRV